MYAKKQKVRFKSLNVTKTKIVISKYNHTTLERSQNRFY